MAIHFVLVPWQQFQRKVLLPHNGAGWHSNEKSPALDRAFHLGTANSSNRAERLFNVFQKIQRILQANRQPQDAVGYIQLRTRFFTD